MATRKKKTTTKKTTAKATTRRKTKAKTSSRKTTKRKSRRSKRRSAVKSLGRELLDTLEAILDLREVTVDPDRSKELRDMQKRLSGAASKLIEANLEANTERYREAREALTDAAGDVRDATKGLLAVVDAVAAVGRAITLLDGLARAA